jgi:hypothetical protein
MLAVFAKVNFQPAASPVQGAAVGYLVDSGLPFADRGNGFTYGWWYQPTGGAATPANNPATRDRNSGNFIADPTAPDGRDQRYDTLNHFHKDGQSPGSANQAIKTWWEINIPNGTYRVRVVAGDADNVDNVMHFIAEANKTGGVPDTDGLSGTELMNANLNGTAGAARWADSGVMTVTVTDGNLTISEGPAAANGKICFIDIETDIVNPVPANPTNLQVMSTAASKIVLGWNDNSSNENAFRIESSPDGTNWSVFGQSPPNTQTFTASGLNPQTTYRFRVFAFNTTGDSAAPTNMVQATTTAATGSFVKSFSATTGDVNLSAEGGLDWVHWGHTAANSLDRKMGVPAPLISDATLLPGSPVAQTTTSPTTFSWTDGTPNASVTASPNVMHSFGYDHGFSFTVPADTNPRVLRIYVGVVNFRGQLIARLSDGSAADVIDSTLFNTGAADGVFTLTYKAGSPGQTLNVSWAVLPPDGDPTAAASRISLKAATLSIPPPPPTGVTSALAAQALPSGRTLLTWTDQSTGEAWYVVERAPDNAGAPGVFAQVGQASALRFYDRTAVVGTRYHYRLRPANLGGEGPNSNVAAVTTVTGPVGTGAQATYFDAPAAGADAKNPVLGPVWPVSNVDPVIDFNFAGNAPAGAGAGFGADNFIVRWTFKVKPDITGDYTFATDTDDGTRVIVNGVKVIDLLDRTGGLLGAPRNFGTPVTLQAGQEYDVTFDMMEVGGNAGARLYWAGPDLPIELVPTSVMYPTLPDTTPPTVTGFKVDAKIPAGLTYTSDFHVGMQFSENVGGSLETTDFFFGDGILFYGPEQFSILGFDAQTNTAIFVFPGMTAPSNGNWQGFIQEATVTDASGNVLDGDNDGQPGGIFTGNFYVSQGDTQLDYFGNPRPDRIVNFIDYQRLAANFGKPNPSHADGDFNHDGVIDHLDFIILRDRFGQMVPPPPPAAPPVGSPAPKAPATKTPAARTAAAVAPVAPIAPVPIAKPKAPAKFASRKITDVLA